MHANPGNFKEVTTTEFIPQIKIDDEVTVLSKNGKPITGFVTSFKEHKVWIEVLERGQKRVIGPCDLDAVSLVQKNEVHPPNEVEVSVEPEIIVEPMIASRLPVPISKVMPEIIDPKEVLGPETVVIPEKLSFIKINELMDSLTNILLKFQHSNQVATFKKEISTANLLRGKLINLVRRINHLQVNESDIHLNKMMSKKADREMLIVHNEANTFLELSEQKLQTLTVSDAINILITQPADEEKVSPKDTTAPIMLAEPIAVPVPVLALTEDFSEKETVLKKFERTKTEYISALHKLVSIRSAIAAGAMPQSAIDEFLDPAIDDVERTQRAFKVDKLQAETFGPIDVTDVHRAEALKPRRSFFSRANKPPVSLAVKNPRDIISGEETSPEVNSTSENQAERNPNDAVVPSDAANLSPTISQSTSEQVTEVAPSTPVEADTATNQDESVDSMYSLANLATFRANYRPDQSAWADDFERWVDSIQGVHSRQHTRFFNINPQPDVYELLKDKTVHEVQNLLNQPQYSVHNTIQLKDLDCWKKFLTTMLWMPELRQSIHQDTTFSEVAALAFMYETLTKNKK